MGHTMTAIAERLSEDVGESEHSSATEGWRPVCEYRLNVSSPCNLACRATLCAKPSPLISEGVLLSRQAAGTFVRWQHETWSEHNIVQPLKTLLEDDPDYSFDILEARHAIEGVPPGMRPYAPPIEKEKIRLCFEATLAEDVDLASKRTSAFTQLPKRRTISYCCRPCAAFSICCKAR
jgi:GntR family L-lactate dehydrogenase operon transcriptional regulator